MAPANSRLGTIGSVMSTPTNSTTAPPSLVTLTAKSTSLCLVSGAASMPADDRERWFRRYGSANALRQWRLDDRDAAIRALAALYDATSGCALAEVVRRDLARYGASGYRVNTAQTPTDAKRPLLHRVLDLVGAGKIPSAGQIREILAGKRS
jgi:hypothetical protein